jgi:uncharacterized protein YbjT (DUF2867 family)
MPENHYMQKAVAVLGATGYVGGRLVPRLLDAGYQVRAIARSASKLKCRPFAGHSNLEIVPADVLDRASLQKALKGAGAVYYLVHSMSASNKDFASKDREAAENLVGAAEENKVERIFYLGGLGEETPDLSHHLRSRLEVGRILQSGTVPLTWLRAAVILGAGSASFELLRYLVERLPVMLTPKWVRTMSQPIAVSNVLDYLLGCLQNPDTAGRRLDIGGPDILSYEDLLQIYAQEAGLPKRIIIPVPLLTPRLSSYWMHLVTPVPMSIARPLCEGLRNEVVCKENSIKELVPIRLLSCREAISTALQKVRQQEVDTCWSDAGEVRDPEWVACGDAPYAGGTVLECNYKVLLDCSAEKVWNVIRTVGGEKGWFYADRLWDLRGLLDRLLGGVGLRRGRRHPTQIGVGDALDFWRVLVVEENRRLQLLAEMKLPGEAILQFQIEPLKDKGCELRQISRFLPRGLAGILYWYSLYPVHQFLFKGMLTKIAEAIDCKLIQEPEAFTGSGNMCVLPPER